MCIVLGFVAEDAKLPVTAKEEKKEVDWLFE
jgi:hypothetical protein